MNENKQKVQVIKWILCFIVGLCEIQGCCTEDGQIRV